MDRIDKNRCKPISEKIEVKDRESALRTARLVIGDAFPEIEKLAKKLADTSDLLEGVGEFDSREYRIVFSMRWMLNNAQRRAYRLLYK